MFSHIFLKVLGLAPFNIKINEFNTKVTSKEILFLNSRIGCGYNIVLIMLLFGSSFLSIPAAFNMKFLNKPQLVKTIFCVKLLAGLSVLLVVWTMQCLKQQRLIEIANEIIAVDDAMNKLQHLYVIESIKLRATIYFIINWLIWIILIILDAQAFPKSFGITSIPILVPGFICTWFLLLFAFVFNVLEVRLCSINSALLKFSRISVYYSESTKNRVAIDQIRIRDLLVIKRAHESLYEAARNITECYACPVFITVIFFCANLIYSAYYFVQLIINPAKVFSILIAVDSSVYLTMELFPIIIMAISVTRLIKQIEITPNMVFEVMDQSTNSQEMKAQLKQFSLELLHRKVEVTAYNFIPLDSSLLHSIAGMVTTYLVILLQMQ